MIPGPCGRERQLPLAVPDVWGVAKRTSSIEMRSSSSLRVQPTRPEALSNWRLSANTFGNVTCMSRLSSFRSPFVSSNVKLPETLAAPGSASLAAMPKRVNAPLPGEPGGRVGRAGPRVAPSGDAAAQRECGEVAPPLFGQRQVHREHRQRCNLEPVERELSSGDAAVGAFVHGHRQRGPARAPVPLGAKRKAARRELALAAFVLPRHVTAEVREIELRQVRRDPGANARELEVGHDVGRLAAGHVEPHAYRALARFDRLEHRQPLPPQPDVGIVEAGIEAALDIAQVLERCRGDVAAQVDRRRQGGGRGSDEAEPQMPEALLDAQGDAVEHELRRAVQVVGPRYECVAHDDFALAQDPVREPAVGAALDLRIDLEARDLEPSLRVAADRKLGPLDRQLLEPQIERDERGPRDQHVHLRQQEHRRARGLRTIADGEARDGQAGVPSIPAAGDRLDGHRLAELLRELLCDPPAILLEARKDQETHREQERQEHDHRRHDHGTGKAQQANGEQWGQCMLENAGCFDVSAREA
jgi:hypothetical protein